MSETNTVERPVMPVAWMSPRDRFYKTRMMAVANCEQLVTPLYALTPEQVYVLEKHAALAAQQPAPAWHDAPTVPGLWASYDLTGKIKENDIPYWQDECGFRWFGPIPPDGDKK